jgi:hypothetical protein
MHKIFQMAVIIFKLAIKYTNTFHSKALQKYPNCDLWYENTPSGNPGGKRFTTKRNLERISNRKPNPKN